MLSKTKKILITFNLIIIYGNSYAQLDPTSNGEVLKVNYKRSYVWYYTDTAKRGVFLDSINLDSNNIIVNRLAPGLPSPEFNLLDLEGKSVSLKDFKGKIVYLDIWASWCSPCRAEIPAAKKLEEELKNQNVVFLYISIDNDEDVWRKIIKEKQMTGIHLISKGGFSSEIVQTYNINGVPRYILIDKNGIIVNGNAKRPSGGIKEEIEKLLN